MGLVGVEALDLAQVAQGAQEGTGLQRSEQRRGDELAQLPMLIAARTVMRTVINRALHGDGDPELRDFYAENDAKLRQMMKET